jgi:hypothetical protein
MKKLNSMIGNVKCIYKIKGWYVEGMDVEKSAKVCAPQLGQVNTI